MSAVTGAFIVSMTVPMAAVIFVGWSIVRRIKESQRSHAATYAERVPCAGSTDKELALAKRKLAEIRKIAANNHIGGMSVPMSERLICLIDNEDLPLATPLPDGHPVHAEGPCDVDLGTPRSERG